jgi:hypothetical protein
MFAGHVGAGLLLGRGARELNAGAFVLAALLLDVLLWVFVLLGLESVAIPRDFAATHQARFVFPYSHGLAGSIGWAALAAMITFVSLRRLPRRAVAASLLGLAVFSHWPLDALVHAPELPLLGAGSTRVGLGLWNHLPAALSVEALITLGGAAVFLAGAPMARGQRIAIWSVCLLVLAFTVIGMTVAPSPPSAVAMALSSLIAVLIVAAVVALLAARARRAAPSD